MSKSLQEVALGLSGGVDSAVAAYLLQEQGKKVTGIFMKNWDEDDGTEYCTAEQDFEDAQKVADKLDIELLAINFAAEYWDLVFEGFLTEYRALRTPNPDVLCNRHIKFDLFSNYADSLGFQSVATGHYADLRTHKESPVLYRARDQNKDQTYFLQAVPRERLANVFTPLASLKKDEVRSIARSRGLHIHSKKDSTGICFIGERRFSDFLARYVPKNSGVIRSVTGEAIGQHIGLPYYTLGQRQGIGVGGVKGAGQAPWYVVDKNPDINELIVSQDDSDLFADGLVANSLNWLIDEPCKHDRVHAVIRYRQIPQPCTVQVEQNELRVAFDQPQRAITPGQYVALYEGEQCLGGGKIDRVFGGRFN